MTVKIEKSRDIAVRYLRIRLGKVRPMTALTRRIRQRTICGRSKSCFMTGGRRNSGIKGLFIGR